MTSSPEIEPSTPSTAGQLLRQARTKAGVHLAVLSVHLKVPVRQLEALEADELDPGKGPVFYRGLAASICRQLNTDPGPVLALLPSLSGQMSPIQTSNLPAGSLIESSRRRTSWGQVFSGKVFWLGFVLLALTLSLVWMPSPAQWAIWDGWHFSFFKPSSSGQLTEEVKLQPPLSPAPVPAPAPADSTANAPATAYPTPPTASVPSPAADVPAVAAESAAKSASAAPPPAPGSVQWVFSAKGESWLELRNNQNAVIWSGTLKQGDVQRVDSPLPVRVVVGRAQVVNVTLRGQPFDLVPHTQVTVARFEVKE